MKKHRQLIALNLVLVLLLSLFPGVAFAAETGTAAEQTAQVEAVEDGAAQVRAVADEPEDTPYPVDPSFEPVEPSFEPVEPTAVPEPTPTPGPEVISLRVGQTVPFTVEGGKYPVFDLNITRSDAYTLVFQPPEDASCKIGNASGANIALYSGPSQYDREDHLGTTYFLYSGETYRIRMEARNTVVNGDWSVTLAYADAENLTLGERCNAPYFGYSYTIASYYVLDIPEDGTYCFSHTRYAGPTGTAFLCSDDDVRSFSLYSSQAATTFSAKGGDRLILLLTTSSGGNSFAVEQVQLGGPFGAQGGNLFWMYDPNNTRLTITGEGEMGSLEKGSPWSAYKDAISSVVVEEGVTEIGDYAFREYPQLNDVEIAGSVQRIGAYAFADAKNLNVPTLSEGLEEIGEGAFSGCTDMYNTIVLPQSLRTIGKCAFADTNLYSITIPSGVTEIGNGAFASRYLRAVTVEANNASFKAIDGVLFTKDGKTLLCFPVRQSGPYAIPAGVTGVAEDALRNAVFLNEVFVPASVKSIGASERMQLGRVAFGGTSAQWNQLVAASSADFTNVLVSFRAAASSVGAKVPFEIASGDQNVDVEYSPASSGVYAVTPVAPDGTVRYVRDTYQASGASLVLYVSDGENTVGRMNEVRGYNENVYASSRYGESLPSVYCLNSAKDYTFQFELHDSVASGTWNLNFQKLPSTALSVGENTGLPLQPDRDLFYTFTAPQDGWYEFSVPQQNGYLMVWNASGSFSTYYYGDYQSFVRGLSKGESIVLTFRNQNSAASFSITINPYETDGQCGENVNWALSGDGVLTISGTGDMDDYYGGTTPWMRFRNQIKSIVVETGVTSVGAEAFSYWSELESVQLADTVRRIGYSAFSESYGLREITLPADLEELDSTAFAWTPLETIKIAAGNTNFVVDHGALYDSARTTLYRCETDCTGEFTVPSTVKTIAQTAFYRCTGIQTLRLPAGLRSMGYSALEYTNFDDIYFGGSAVDWYCLNVGSWSGEVHFAKAPSAPATTLGTHIDSIAPGVRSEAYSFIAPQDGLYRLRHPGSRLAVFSEDGTQLTSLSAGYSSHEFGLKRGTKVFICLSAYDESQETVEWSLSLATTKNLSLGDQAFTCDGTTAFYRFVPTESGKYSFYGTTYDRDTIAWLYDAEGTLIASNDDGAGSMQFIITQALEAGKTYYLGVRFYGEGSVGNLTFRAEKAVVWEQTLSQGSNYINIPSGGFEGTFTAPQDGWYWLAGRVFTYDGLSFTLTDGEGSALSLTEPVYLREGGTLALSAFNRNNGTYTDAYLYVGFNETREGDYDTIHWSISEDNVLTISGSDYMPYWGRNYDLERTGAPWQGFASVVREIRVEEGVESISAGAFYGMSAVTSVSLPDSLRYVEGSAFGNCTSLTELCIPASVYSFDTNALYRCTALSAIEVAEDNSNYTSVDGVLLSADGTQLLLYPRAKSGAYVVPDGVKSIAYHAFYDCDALTGVTLPVGLSVVNGYAFEDCSNLRHVTIPATVTQINYGAFGNCALNTVTYLGTEDQWNRISIEGWNESLTNAQITFAEHEGLVLYAQPEDAYGVVGDVVRFTVDAGGYGLKYAWELSKDGGETWTKSSSTTAVATCTLTSASRNGWLYRCTVTDSIGSSITTDAAMVHAIAFTGEALQLGENFCQATSLIFTAPEAGTYRIVSQDYPSALYREDASPVPMENNRFLVDLEAGERVLLTVEYSSDDPGFNVNVAKTTRPQPVTLVMGENTVEVNGEIRCPFTPEVSGVYSFRSLNDGEDTYATLYDEFGNYITSNDDSGGNGQFLINRELEAGKTYLLGVRYYSRDRAGTIRVSVSFPLAITSQPQDAFGAVGEKVTFRIAASGVGVTYQWQYSKDGGETWRNSSSTSEVATCTLVDASREGWLYRCLVSDAGGQVLVSDTATVRLYAGPEITLQPQDSAGKIGEKAYFKLEAEGKDLTYQWQYSKNNGKTWSNSSSKTAFAFCTLVDASRDGWRYRCVVTDRYGNAVTSEQASVIVKPAITVQPQDARGRVGEKLSFTVEATGKDVTYQWYYSKDGGRTWLKSSSTSTTATCTLVDASRDGWLYRCTVKDANGNVVLTRRASVVLYNGPTITMQPENSWTALGRKAYFEIAAEGVDLTYQWQYSKDGGKTWLNSSSKTTSATCTISDVSRDGWLYRCVVKDSYGYTVVSDTAEVVIPPQITAHPGDAYGRIGEKVTFTVEADGKDLRYEWFYSKDGGYTWLRSSSTTNTATCTLVDAGRDGWLYRCVVTNAAGRSVESYSARVHVIVGPVITLQPADAYGRVGMKANFTLAAVGDDITYQWQYSKDGGYTWLISSSTTTTATCTLASMARDGWLYRCVVSDSHGNTTMTRVARVHVVVGPIITSQPQDAVGKVGDKVTFRIVVDGENLTYQWYLSKDDGETWTKSSSTTAVATCTLSSASRNGWLYRCVVTDGDGNSVVSDAARVIVQK